MREEITRKEIQLDLAGIQTVALDILCATQEYCVRHGLHPYLCGGTLLGAVRHGGFIPWDDDIDVFLSRPEFEKLKQLVKNEPIRDDLILAYRENKQLLRPFMRVYNTNTTVLHETMHVLSHRHIWVDILPVDGMPSDLKRLRFVQKKRHYISVMNTVAMWRVGTHKNPVIRFKRYLLWPIAKLFGAGFWSSWQIRYSTRYDFDTSEYVGCVAAGKYGPGERMPREEYVKPVPITFEGRPFETMSCWDSYLHGIFGNYLELPPENKRIPPHTKYAGITPEGFERVMAAFADVYQAKQASHRNP